MTSPRVANHAWQQLWLGFDPATVEANLGPARGGPSLLLGLLMNLVCTSRWGARRFVVEPTCVWATFAPWALLGLVGLVGGAAVLNREGRTFAFLRFSYLLSSVAYGASFGASSSLAASPTYAMGLVTASACGVFLPARSRALIAGFALTPLALRLCFAASPTASSCLVALVMGLLGAAIATQTSRRLADEARLAEVVGPPPDPESTVRLALLTAVHDHLSGLLLVARTRAATASSVEEVRHLTAQIVARGSELVGGGGRADLGRLARDLDEVAKTLGCRVTLAIEGPAGELPHDDRRQLVELATESTLNALRAGREQAVDLRISVDGREVSFYARSAASESPRGGGGRGLRYARLRAALRGGVTDIDQSHGFVLHTRWPRTHAIQRRGFPTAAVTIAAFLLPALVLALAQQAWWPFALSAYATLSAAVLFEQMRRAGRALEERARRALAEVDAGLAARTRAVIAPRHEAMLDALAANDIDLLREALGGYVEGIRTLLAELEAAPVEGGPSADALAASSASSA